MTIKALAECVLEKMEDGEYKTNMLSILEIFGMRVIKEIHRLNFPAFSCLEDDDYTKQGFVDAMLNCLIDDESKKYHCNKAWNSWDCEPPHNRMLIVEKDRKLYFAKYTDKDTWIDQDGETVIENITRWREFSVQHY